MDQWAAGAMNRDNDTHSAAQHSPRGDKSWVDSFFFGPVVSGLNYISVCGERITALTSVPYNQRVCVEREMMKRKVRACVL